MFSAFLVCCIHSNALQTRFFMDIFFMEDNVTKEQPNLGPYCLHTIGFFWSIAHTHICFYLSISFQLIKQLYFISEIPTRYHTFVEIDHEIISTVILLLLLIYSRRVVVSYKRKYVHKLLVNRLLKPARKKCG